MQGSGQTGSDEKTWKTAKHSSMIGLTCKKLTAATATERNNFCQQISLMINRSEEYRVITPDRNTILFGVSF